MSHFKQMKLVNHDDPLDVTARVESEQELAALAWAIIDSGLLADLTASEMGLVDSAGQARGFIIGDLAGAIQQGGDPLGDAFVRLRSARQRRPLGAVYTPPEIVEAMVGWIASKGRPARMVDPGSGSGRFALEAGRVFPDASLVAVELDPLAALLCRANLTAAGLDDRARVVVGDYRQVDLGRCDGVTAFTGNPPYVRHHQIEPRWKQWLTSSAASRGLPVSGLAGMHIHFFLATLLHARPGDLGAFITSAEWMDVNYGRLLRGMLTDGLGGESVHVLAPEAMPFEGTATTASVTCFQVGSEASSVKMRRVQKVEDLANLAIRRHAVQLRRPPSRHRPARRPPAFVRNLVGARHVNVAHGIYPREPLADALLDALAASLRTGVSVAQGRTYAGGLTKFKPSEMERIPVPNPALLADLSS